ncbi:zinc finger protein HD1-like isoform X1 [Ipomoea triloba]|uniref:zinc finger protein HD1-like isoform X1 n=1 Tax=Ipomoea triloba TaxID=35885 RepID=UPI00125E6F36|nr:zinc finger protein HD1-like isoform X1 [Ipomoea triloba]
MYAENGLMFPYWPSFPQEAQQLEDLYCSQRPNASLTASSISDYDLGGEGDLFKAPEPIIEEPLLDLDPMTAAISLISCGDDVISPQGLEISDIQSSFENGQLLSEVFYECKKDLLAKDGIEAPLSEDLDVKILIAETDEKMASEVHLDSQGSLQKSVSSESLNTMDWAQGAPLRPNFFDFPGMDFGAAAYGMRRSLSDGDIKTLGNDNINLIHSPHGQSQIIRSSISEDRKEKLSRYRIKKAKRNFGRKIKYACRKALADSQPRIRGRFAKTEEADGSKSKKH